MKFEVWTVVVWAVRVVARIGGVIVRVQDMEMWDSGGGEARGVCGAWCEGVKVVAQ